MFFLRKKIHFICKNGTNSTNLVAGSTALLTPSNSALNITHFIPILCSSYSFLIKHRYGKVFKSHLFGSPTIVSTDAEVSRIVLQSDANSFVPSYPKSLTELMGECSILRINGSLHRRIHGLIGSFFKSPYLKAQVTCDMRKLVMQSMAAWEEDRPIYIQDETKHVCFLYLIMSIFTFFKNNYILCLTNFNYTLE
ncbi:putative 3-epi-6-deoxocathasterone 23-monooxygenase [Helianthus annuus]|nr:putative 3-epi-6-deoxocathasterone 23-monooxygenase [Helianthus annuus]KAJ0523561.1 putative 3-epi-6-deoxocathasterone 23-monooxygenase [Helianthus annuus]KAJ0698173.1 putative 3-epi-6-deoxocathasterone 23-monooxygenase [Helianthus annuus]KAJ0701540.1 putative 3-epi-6-deoxocathasterone 23-monooxygenase [Helianthus annuus]